MRDAAAGGLATLLRRPEWRTSSRADALQAAVTDALHDTNPVVRMRAAEGVRGAFHPLDPADLAAKIGELLLAEKDGHVRTVLLRQLAGIAASAPTVVDVFLERLDANGDLITEHRAIRSDVAVDLLTYLALVPGTDFASRTVAGWCADAVHQHTTVTRFAACARDYLTLSSGTGQARGFALLQQAAEACRDRLARDPAELATPAAELPKAALAELEGAVKVCHGVAQQIYFASGAFDDEPDSDGPRPSPDPTFAQLALPILRACASTGVAQVAHPAVQTLIFLAPLDEAQTLIEVADAVPPGASYAGDQLAGDAVMPYLERLLAEQRRLVLHDPDGSDAFRRLLATFAVAGNQEALALAYAFADVFR